MIQLKHASKGKKMNSLTANFISKWYKENFNILVDLPVATQKSLLVFSLQRELKKRAQFQKLSNKSYMTLISVISSSLGSLDEKSMMKAIAQAGLDFKDEDVKSILTEIKREVTKQITGAGIASILVADVLQAKMSRVEPIKEVSFSGVIDAVSRTQDLYGSFAQSQSLAVVGEQIQSMFQNVPLIKHIYDVWVSLNRHKSATVKGRLTYALDSLFESTFGNPMMEMETMIPGMHYHINKVGIVEDLKYRQVVCTYFVSLRGLLGIEASEKGVAIKLSDLLDHFLLNIPEGLPSLPKDLACSAAEMKQGQDVFSKMWLMNAYQMILTGDEGQLSHQISNVMEERKYTRNETWDVMVREGISIASIVFSAYIKTGAQFRDWARDEDIYFSNDAALPHNVKLKLNKFVFEIVQGYNSFLRLDHPRFLHNPAHIVNFAEQTRVVDDTTYYVPDDQIKFNKAQWIITPDLERTLIYKNQKIQGTDMDLEMDVMRPLLPMALPIAPLLGFTISRPPLFGGDISTAFLGIQSLKHLVSQTNIPGEILKQSELVLISDKTDLAETFDISEEIAEMIWKGPDMYASLARQSIMFITWDHDTAPVVEMSSIDPSKLYIPFIGKYPYLLKYSNQLPSMVGLPKGPNEPKDPSPGVKDPKKGDEPADPKDPKDPSDPNDPKPNDPADPKD